MIVKTLVYLSAAVGLSMGHHGLSLPLASLATERANFTFDQLFNFTQTFVTALKYPNNIKQANEINSTFFAENVFGRVDITGEFQGVELNTEYIFALFNNATKKDIPSYNTLFGPILEADIVHFSASGDIASATTILTYDGFPSVYSAPLVWTLLFNQQGQILEYDVMFPLVEWSLDDAFNRTAQALNLTSTDAAQVEVQQLIATSICAVHDKFCTGANQQYATNAECMNTLVNEKPLGRAYQWSHDTVGCRCIHQAMVPLRPEVHCPHIGPTGGNFCVNGKTYEETILEPVFSIPLVPVGYENKNATIAAQ
ncbi:hypothetical protein THAR02_01745 [Trichoderma harzianum]|uniref:Uncharacterized protein n=1 Tax=Trichoderma harzianum TaxID=5544 RepID=A0A0G0A1H1_TRIHA|nr:hypothetical protein THAR02_01745 [Trichoderma harzianum]